MHQSDAQIFANTLAAMPAANRPDAMADAVTDAGGEYAYRQPMRCLFEIQLHSVYATDWTEEEAIQNWINAAKRPPKGIRATDGRDDCPYNGQGLAPVTPQMPRLDTC